MKRNWILLMSLMVLVLYSCGKTVRMEDYTKLQNANSALNATNQSLSAENGNLMDENKTLMKDRDLLKEQLASAQELRDTMQGKLMKISNDYVALQNRAGNSTASLGKQIEALQASIKDKDLQIKGLNDQIATKDGTINDLDEKLAAISAQESQAMKQKEAEISNLTVTSANIMKQMKKEISDQNLQVSQIGDILNIDFVDKIFFDSGSADIKKTGKDTLNRLSSVLKSITNKQIRVEGYTDNVPIAESYKWKFPSNWELSTARATTMVRYLQSQGVDPSFLKATGYGEYNPVGDNKTEEGRAENRRIVVQLVPLDARSKSK